MVRDSWSGESILGASGILSVAEWKRLRTMLSEVPGRPRVVWKTTTQTQNRRVGDEREMVARHLPDAIVLDGWGLTSALPPTRFIDNIHVDASTNNELNRELAKLLYPADPNRPEGLFCAGPPPLSSLNTTAVYCKRAGCRRYQARLRAKAGPDPV